MGVQDLSARNAGNMSKCAISRTIAGWSTPVMESESVNVCASRRAAREE